MYNNEVVWGNKNYLNNYDIKISTDFHLFQDTGTLE